MRENGEKMECQRREEEKPHRSQEEGAHAKSDEPLHPLRLVPGKDHLRNKKQSQGFLLSHFSHTNTEHPHTAKILHMSDNNDRYTFTHTCTDELAHAHRHIYTSHRYAATIPHIAEDEDTHVRPGWKTRVAKPPPGWMRERKERRNERGTCERT